MSKPIAVLVAVVIASTLAIGALPVLLVAALAGSGGPSQTAIIEIPPSLLAHYQQAGTRCVAVGWATLAGIGDIESGHGQHRIDPTTGDTIGLPILGYQPVGPDTDHGTLDTDPTHDWAVGPMQITPATFTTYATLGTDRSSETRPNPSNAWDAIATAARYLCELDAQLGHPDIARLLAAYNCGPAAPRSCGTDYAQHVQERASHYRTGTPSTDVTATGDIAVVIATALAQLGKPFVFGTQGPDTFDCSGLITYAYRAISIDLPAYTFTLVTQGVAIPVDQIQPGDLIFTRGGVPAEDYGHVALAISTTQEIQAPRTGDVVKITPIPSDRIQAIRRIVVARVTS